MVIHAVSNSKFDKYYWENLTFFITVPSNLLQSLQKREFLVFRLKFLDQKCKYQISLLS